jgi:hypothetical protein
MNLPERAIAALDRALMRTGHDVTLRRLAAANAASGYHDATVRAHVRSLREDELLAGITQDDQLLIMSPTQIAAAAWPNGTSDIPRKGDKVIVSGTAVANVQFVKPIRLGGTLVRIEMRIRG